MSPPFSRVERGSPPPRRKSCLACVKAKRRCDQKSPSCLRCTQRRLTCEYPTRTPRISRTQPWAEAQTTALLASRQDHGESGFLDCGTAGEDPWTTPGDLTPYSVFPWPDEHVPILLSEGPALSLEPTSEWPSITPLRDITLLEDEIPGQESLLPAIRTDKASAEATQALPVIPTGYFNIEAVSAELDGKLSYALRKIKSAPNAMLQELELPWCHASLYRDEMPRAMQDVLSACALYASKNSINGSLIMRCIDAKMNDLLASHISADFLYALARVQALLLYQIIRFFDGDILARSSADASFYELRSSAQALVSHIVWDPQAMSNDPNAGVEMTLFPLQPSRSIWKRWVLQESARRTFLIACFFVNVWKRLTGRQVATCRSDSAFLGQSWTLSAKLWQASDAVDFAAAWRERRHYIVRRRAIVGALADANNDDIEAFGKMLLTVSMGVEEARAWLALKGISL